MQVLFCEIRKEILYKFLRKFICKTYKLSMANYFNITDEIIHTTIMKEAKSQLEHYRKKIFK
ncbi:hypothetical protein CN265_12740 [Priestia megaterium]|nr:hypothetical protein CN265_12740 [Priestia megaterium]PFL00481.1 hypothetical protein COJ01_13860 [Priestia megaterium]